MSFSLTLLSLYICVIYSIRNTCLARLSQDSTPPEYYLISRVQRVHLSEMISFKRLVSIKNPTLLRDGMLV